MSANLVLILTASVMIGSAVYLILERSLTRVLVGVLLLSNGVNLMLLISGGQAGEPPLVGKTPEPAMADPLPQALILTAIVITLGTMAFVLAMGYRSWLLNGHDDVQDDAEDAAIRRMAVADQPSGTFELSDDDEPVGQPGPTSTHVAKPGGDDR